MTESSHLPAVAGPSQRSVEIGFAVATIVFAIVVIVGSLQAGIDWGAEGPKAGFFPF
jgi:putative tricarboxylic transport membrane protein